MVIAFLEGVARSDRVERRGGVVYKRHRVGSNQIGEEGF